MLEFLTGYLSANDDSYIPLGMDFHAPFPFAMCLGIVLLAGLGVGWFYAQQLQKLSRRMRWLLISLRVISVLILTGLILDPVIRIRQVSPGNQVVALLFDDSMSMRIGAGGDQSRGETLLERYSVAGEKFEAALAQQHGIQRYRIGKQAEPISSIHELRFEARDSHLLDAIAQVEDDLQGTTISAIILFSDGVQQGEMDTVTLDALQKDIPVYTVGIGEQNDWSDIELRQVTVHDSGFSQRPVVLMAEVNAHGYAGQSGIVELRDGDRVLAHRSIEFADSEDQQSIRMEWIPDQQDWSSYTLRVRLKDEAIPEKIIENNEYSFVLDHREKRYRILYVSGRPNWQHSFVSRALQDDPESKLSSLIYISIAEPKFEFRGQNTSFTNPLFEGFGDDPDRPRYDEAVFLRIGMGADELASGFPTRAEDLFVYDVIIFGDIERKFLSDSQLKLVREFVEKRGGAFLMLGGVHTFRDGGYVSTPIDSMLPALQYSDYEDPETRYVETLFRAHPTTAGKLSGVWSIHSETNEDSLSWDEMPSLYGLNRFPLTRIAATVLSEKTSDGSGDDAEPLFAFQRYGEGMTAILSTGETWQWQMQLPKENEQHERLWRQITRFLSNQVLDPVQRHVEEDNLTRWTSTTFAFTIRDESYETQENLQSTLEIQSPSGKLIHLPLDESLEDIGLYRGDFIPEETGIYTLHLSALDEDGTVVAELDERIVVEEDHREYRQAQYDGAFLQSLADYSGGAYLTLDDLDTLPQKIAIPLHDNSQEILLHLWHLPVFYVLLVLLLATEWYLRRKRGYA